MAFVRTRIVKQQLCDALGLDAGKVASMTIRIEPDDVMRIDVQLFAEDNPTVNAAILAVAAASDIAYTVEEAA